MIWLKAAWNCFKKGVKSLVISIGITAAILAACFGVVCLISLIGAGIEMITYTGVWTDVGNFIGKVGPWILGGLILVMFGILVWDGICAEKNKLEAKANAKL